MFNIPQLARKTLIIGEFWSSVDWNIAKYKFL